MVQQMRKKKTVSVTISPDLLEWIKQQIKLKRFAHRSHAIEYALMQLKLQNEKKTLKE